jgi:tRNA/tmRNA/rRNA uracil-C5-methylase (TrmA/RlmC/RlmD family)/23S rRNA-/tRNA-specific pseudouridylate synthase
MNTSAMGSEGPQQLKSGLGPPPPLDTQRIECAHADRCGGCPIIALAYGEQLALKRGRVVQSVARYPALELVYTEPVAAAEPVVAYRTRAKLIVAPGAKIGLYAKGGGHQVVDIPSCRVLSPILARIAELLRQATGAAELAMQRSSPGANAASPMAPFEPGPWSSRTGTTQPPAATTGGALRAIDLREVRDERGEPRVLVTLVLQRARAGDLEEVRAAARALMDQMPEVAGVAVNFHEGDAPQILGNETQLIAGEKALPDRLGTSVHLATYGSFVQAHRGQAERVHRMLIEQLGIETRAKSGAPTRVLDLYGGSGAIALGLAAAGASVTLVESFAPAVEQARSAALAQSLKLQCEHADAATALRTMFERGDRFDSAVVNPPRRGMSALAREWLARFDLGVLAYVSCDPDTLARDLDHLARLGYWTTSLRPLDMIPLTDEVETVAILRKGSIPTPRVVYEDEEIVVVEKGPHEPTAPQGEYKGSLLGRARKLPNAQNAVPIHRIDIGTSGLVMLAKSPDFVQKWAAALQAPTARKIYVAAARGVTPSKGAITRELREDGKLYPARTRYRRLAVASGHSVLRVIPEQGRTHQIRRHLAAIGHPVLGDDRYGHGPTNRFFEEKNGLDRAFLHCVRIEIEHPTRGNRLIVEAPLPGDLRAVLERTSGPGTLRFLDHKNALGTSGISSLPPPPDTAHDRGSALSIDTSSVTLRPEMIGDDDESGPNI